MRRSAGATPKVIASALASCGTEVAGVVGVVAVGELVDAARGVEQGRVDALLEVGRLARPRGRVGLPRRGDGLLGSRSARSLASRAASVSAL